MGTSITVGGFSADVISWSVSESATPLAGGDTSGGTGSLTFSIPVAPLGDFMSMPEPHTATSLYALLQGSGPGHLMGAEVTLNDTNRGYTVGRVVGASWTEDSRVLEFQCEGRLQTLNVFGVQAQPFVGSLGNAFRSYLALAGVTEDLFVDPEVEDRPVIFPGWNGELWLHLKEMAAAQDCDVTLVSGVIVLRPIRSRVADRGRATEGSTSFEPAQLAQGVEVYMYDYKNLNTNTLVYPPGGWSSDIEVLSVNAGETIEQVIELSASVSSIVQPTMTTFVGPNDSSASVYTVVADDGLPVTPSAWSSHGGRVEVEINPDTTSLTVRLTGATGLPTAMGTEASSFSLALASDSSGSQYSTLRVLGRGVGFTKESRIIRTGVGPLLTATEVGVTIDNPFVSSIDDLYRVGTRAAKQYAGVVRSLNVSVVSVNRPDARGAKKYPSYDEVFALQEGSTYATVGAWYTGTLGLGSYDGILDYWFGVARRQLENPEFGNTSGARFFDRYTRRWYRVRDATLNPDSVSVTAEDDLTHDDFQWVVDETGWSYFDIEAGIIPGPPPPGEMYFSVGAPVADPGEPFRRGDRWVQLAPGGGSVLRVNDWDGSRWVDVSSTTRHTYDQVDNLGVIALV